MTIEAAITRRIRKQARASFQREPTDITKIGTEAYLVTFGKKLMKVRVSYAADTKRRGPPFLIALDIHRQLQEKFPEVPKIIKYVDRGTWKFKFVEWVEGETFNNISKRLGSFTEIPEGLLYKFGYFMHKVKKLGIYGKDGQTSHALYRLDMDMVTFCDLGAWSLSRDRRNERVFLGRFLVRATEGQKGRFYDGYSGKK